jgi:hypothetical protein
MEAFPAESVDLSIYRLPPLMDLPPSPTTPQLLFFTFWSLLFAMSSSFKIYGDSTSTANFSSMVTGKVVDTFEILLTNLEWNDDGTVRSTDEHITIQSVHVQPTVLDGASARRIRLSEICHKFGGKFVKSNDGFSLHQLPLQTATLLMDISTFEIFKEWVQQPRNARKLRHYPFLVYIGVRLLEREYTVVEMNKFRRRCSFCQKREVDMNGAANEFTAASKGRDMFTEEIAKLKSFAPFASVPPVLLECPCFQAQYCGTECQKAHWAEHKRSAEHTKNPKANDAKPKSSNVCFYALLIV